MLKILESFGAEPYSISLEMKKNLLEKLEVLTGPLSDDYRNFLLYFGGSVLFNVDLIFKGIQHSVWANSEGYDAIESLYGLEDSGHDYTIFEAIDTYHNEFRDQFIPIGSSSGGNEICLCIHGDMKGQIWFWDHESDPMFDMKTVLSGMTLIENSFQKFINKLKIDDEEPNISGVKNVTLDF